MNETVREVIGWVLYSAIIILLVILLVTHPQQKLDCNDCGRLCYGIVNVGGEQVELPEANISINYGGEPWDDYSTKQ